MLSLLLFINIALPVIKGMLLIKGGLFYNPLNISISKEKSTMWCTQTCSALIIFKHILVKFLIGTISINHIAFLFTTIVHIFNFTWYSDCNPLCQASFLHSHTACLHLTVFFMLPILIVSDSKECCSTALLHFSSNFINFFLCTQCMRSCL